MNEIVEMFENEEFKMRTIEKNGEIWFVAKDIAEALGYATSEKMTRRLDDDEKEVQSIENIKKPQNGDFENATRGILIINESGLYNAILGSQKPEAKKFKKWVTSEVLPAIRKKGSYSLTESREKINAMIEMRVEEKLTGFIEVIEKTMGEIEEEERVERNEFLDKIMAGAKEGFEKKREYIFMPMEEFQKMVLRHEEEIAELKKEIIEMKKDEGRLDAIKKGKETQKKITEMQTELRTTKKMCSDILDLNKKYKGE